MQAQLRRDTIVFVSILASCVLYYEALSTYLSSLSNPKPFMFILMVSLGVSIFYELRGGVSRGAIISVLSTILVFIGGCFLAEPIRDMYLLTLESLKELPAEQKASFGQEYISAAQNPAVGIGACLAAGVSAIRISAYNFIKNFLCKLLIINFNPQRCQYCGQLRSKDD